MSRPLVVPRSRADGVTAHDPTDPAGCFCPRCRGERVHRESSASGRFQGHVRRRLRLVAPIPETPTEPVSADQASPPLSAVGFLRMGSPNSGQPYLALPKYLLSGNLIGWRTRVHWALWPVFNAMLYCLDLSGPNEQRVTATRPRLGELSGVTNRGTLRAVLRILEEGAPAQRAWRGRPATPALPALFAPVPKGWTWRPAGFAMLRQTCLAVLGHGDRAAVEHAMRLSVRGRAGARMRWRRPLSRTGAPARRRTQ